MIQVAGIMMTVLGVFGKFGALFVTLPDPLIGGIYMTTFGKEWRILVMFWGESGHVFFHIWG